MLKKGGPLLLRATRNLHSSLSAAQRLPQCFSATEASYRASEASCRGFSTDNDESSASPRVKQLAEEIMHLNLLEISDLTEILQKRLGLTPGFGNMMMPQGGGMPAQGNQTAAPTAPEAPKEPEKTEFDVKLDGFDAAAKIKVIKEIRVITELGLKEAKELVEKSPVVIKAGMKKEEAEELKKKLEAVGAKIVLE